MKALELWKMNVSCLGKVLGSFRKMWVLTLPISWIVFQSTRGRQDVVRVAKSHQ